MHSRVLRNGYLTVLLQDHEISELYQKNQNEVKSVLRSLPTNITSLHQLKQEILEIIDQIKKVGDEKGIKKYIKELQQQVDQIKQKSKLSADEIKAYEELLKKETEINKSIVLYTDDKKRVVDFGVQAKSALDQLRQRKEIIAENLSTEEARTLLRGELTPLDGYLPAFSEKIDKVEKLIKGRVVQLGQDLSATQKALAPYASKFQYQSELNKKNEEIKDEQKKLDQLLILNKELKEKQVQYQQHKDGILGSYKSIFEKYEELRNEFKKYEDRFQDISLSVTVGFNEESFNQTVIHETLNKSDIKRLVNDSWSTEYQYSYEPTKHLDFITKIFEGILNNSITTIKNKSGKDAVVKLMDNFFSIDFKISYKNDSLDKMSPGKKGFVLLRLLIELSNEEWPILLDQPEDDLDNRSVYDDLVEFMKSKKKSRQMLIVTHNPNLVVGADAEVVIVANQEGQELGRDNRKYRFEYVSGALEDTFENDQEPAILYKKGIREHVCEVLEGGEEAFKKRGQKYRFS